VRDQVDGNMGIYVEDVRSGEVVALDADSEYETMSVIKVPVMTEVYRRAAAGTLDLDRRVALDAGRRRLPSGVLYALDPGLRPTIRDLVTLMIIVSDNQATDVLADMVGRDAVTRAMAGLGLTQTRLAFSDLDWDRAWLARLDPSWSTATGDATIGFPFAKYPAAAVDEAFRDVIEESGVYFGLSTPRDTGRLFALMARGRLVSEKASAAMIDILERQQVNDRIPRYLGEGVRTAHKTGDGQPWVANDAGIVWIGDRPIVMAFFIGRHRGTTAEAHEAIARAAARVVRHYGGEVDPAGLR
jgi:beta-lactamase class A